MPSDRFGALHGAMVIVSGVPGLAAAALAVGALLAWGPRPRVEGVLGGLLLAFSLTNFVIYTVHWVSGDEPTILLPAIQKVSLGLLVAWMTRVALRVMRSRPAQP